jgi:iron complex outermembrane receptor protein
MAQTASCSGRRQGDQSATSLGDVVVTARRREEAVRDVPSTITASASTNWRPRARSKASPTCSRPCQACASTACRAENLAEVSVRGSGTQRATSADSGVGLFVNGAYVGSSTLGGRNFKRIDYFDLADRGAGRAARRALRPQLRIRHGQHRAGPAALPDTAACPRPIPTTSSRCGWKASSIRRSATRSAVRLSAQVTGQGGGIYYNPNQNKYYDHTDGYIVRGQIRHSDGPLDINLMIDAQDMNLPTFANQWVIPAGKVAYLPQGYTGPRYDIRPTSRTACARSCGAAC